MRCVVDKEQLCAELLSLNLTQLKERARKDLDDQAVGYDDMSRDDLLEILGDHHDIYLADGHLSCGCDILGCICWTR